ncbi:glycosyltransferase family 4 protein [Curtanaerobium respiraculi]|uniref:glycosyltransferase family 4 protein n=1 Tax=Curtanaerobium respiraculi TaxID=2949669 RepID=UPI0024B32095|nr:glycosyltransferase family 4 protein [Curtanaerobium respiraculi]
MEPSSVYALFSAQYRPHAGGVESFTERLAHQLVAEGNGAVVVTSLLDNSPAYEVQADGVEVYRLPCFSLMAGRLPISRKNGEYKHEMRDLEQRRITRVLVNTRFYRHSLEGLRFARRMGAPVVILDHGSAHLTLGNAFLDRFVEGYEHGITERVKRFRPTFAGISRASTVWLRHFDIETDYVIPNAIDVDAFQSIASPRDFRRELDISSGCKLASLVGRLEPEKGVYEFARSSEQLGKGYVLALAGEGGQREKIEALGLPNVALLGNLSQADLSALLRDSDIFCLPSRSEGFCTSVLESSAWGIPPVMTHVGGTDEVMGNPPRYGAYLTGIEPSAIADAIRGIEDAAKEREGLVKFVRENCSWSNTVRLLENVFSSIS